MKLQVHHLASILAISLVLSAGLTSAIQYKPWGVPDVRRAEYEQKIAEMHQNSLGSAKTTMRRERSLQVDRYSHSFGRITSCEGSLSTSFRIANRTPRQMHLEVSNPSPQIAVDFAQADLAPFEESVAHVSWQPESEEDVLKGAVFNIHAVDGEKFDEIRFALSANLAESWAIDPEMRAEKVAVASEPWIASAVIVSERFESMVVLETAVSDPSIDIVTIPLNANEVQKIPGVKSGLLVRATLPPGHASSRFQEQVRILVSDPDSGQQEWLQTTLSGKYRSAVSFFGPEITVGEGLQLDLIELGSDDVWSFGVRFRTELPIKEAVIVETKPDSLTASIEPSDRMPGVFRVTVRLADDAKPARFRGDPQGYVKIAAADDAELHGWMPLLGEIIEPVADR